MKYLKFYEEIKSSSNDEICKTLKDILLELRDVGYVTCACNPSSLNLRQIKISIRLHGIDRRYHGANKYVHIDEELFNETILRIKDYMKFEGYLLYSEYIGILPISGFCAELEVGTLIFTKYKKKYANLFKK